LQGQQAEWTRVLAAATAEPKATKPKTPKASPNPES
jgi:hypothetical protein